MFVRNKRKKVQIDICLLCRTHWHCTQHTKRPVLSAQCTFQIKYKMSKLNSEPYVRLTAQSTKISQSPFEMQQSNIQQSKATFNQSNLETRKPVMSPFNCLYACNVAMYTMNNIRIYSMADRKLKIINKRIETKHTLKKKKKRKSEKSNESVIFFHCIQFPLNDVAVVLF